MDLKKCFFLFVVIFSVQQVDAVVMKTSLKAAMDKGDVVIEANSTDKGFSGKGIRLSLKNRTNNALQIMVDPALIFKPVDTSFQDLVIAGEVMLAIAPNSTGNIELQTFCGKSNARAPGSGLKFQFRKQGDSTMIKVLQFINKNQLYGNAGQQAIWVLTNDHDLNTVFDPEQPEVSEKLVALMVTLTGLPSPDNFRLYRINTTAGEPVFEQRVLKIISNFYFTTQDDKTLSLGIYDQDGTLLQPIENERPFQKGRHKMMVSFEAENVKPGDYFIRLKEGNVVMKEQVVQVD